MTPAEFVEARKLMGWSRLQIARWLVCDERVIRQMETGQQRIPPPLVSWLTRAVHWLTAHPPPDNWRTNSGYTARD